MAKKSRTLNEALNDNDKDFKKKIKKAVREATKDAVKDIHGHALSCIQDYYDEYEPTSYHRSGALKNAIVKTSSVKNHGDYIVSTAGIIFDFWALDSYVDDIDDFNYGYGASSKYIRVDGSWVLENYLMGIHPTTNGSRIPEEVEYIPITFSPSPDQKMKDNLKDYKTTFDSNLYKYFHMQ